MPQLLTDIVLEEISLVDRPANPGAKVAFFKRDGDTVSTSTPHELAELVRIGKADTRHREDFEAAMDELAKVLSEKTGQDFYSCYTAVCKTPLGRQLYEGSRQAQPRDTGPVAKAAPIDFDAIEKATNSGYAEAERLADEAHRQLPSVAREEHFARIWKERPDLRARDEDARRVKAAKRQ